MDREAVIEFLGHVPLLRSLPRSSLKKIAELVDFKYYDRGDYVLREGEVGDDIYFIVEGEAKVLGHDNVEEGNCPKLLLKKYDHFGNGVKSGPRNTQYDKGKGKAILEDEYGYSSDDAGTIADEGDAEGDDEEEEGQEED